MRQLGGSVGIALSATLVQRFATIDRAVLAAQVTPFSDAARERLAALTALLAAKGTPATVAGTRALAIVNEQVRRQALMLSFEHLFLLFGAAFVLSLPLLLLMHKPRGMPGGGGLAH
jgi:DHA2 family multidrug resistance protein